MSAGLKNKVMNLVKLSNTFNIAAQAVGIQQYFFGTESDINRNRDTNLNPGNVAGNKYPLLVFEPPTAVLSYSPKPRQKSMQIVLDFADLHYRNNASQPTAASFTDCALFTRLETLVESFFDFLRTMQKSSLVANDDRFSISNVTLSYFPHQHNDNLAVIQAQFEISAAIECAADPNEDWTNLANVEAAINAGIATYPVPVTTTDYETKRPS